MFGFGAFMALQSVVCFYSSSFWFLLTQWVLNAAIMRMSFRVVFAVVHDLWTNNQNRQCCYVRAKLPCTPFFNAFILTSYTIMPCNSIHKEKEDIDSFQPLFLRYLLFRIFIFSPGCLGCGSFKRPEESRADSFLTFLDLPWPFRPATVGCQQLGYSQWGRNVLLLLT